jgi:hypothetical protein
MTWLTISRSLALSTPPVSVTEQGSVNGIGMNSKRRRSIDRKSSVASQFVLTTFFFSFLFLSDGVNWVKTCLGEKEEREKKKCRK